jgi:hypothetical protein
VTTTAPAARTCAGMSARGQARATARIGKRAVVGYFSPELAGALSDGHGSFRPDEVTISPASGLRRWPWAGWTLPVAETPHHLAVYQLSG